MLEHADFATLCAQPEVAAAEITRRALKGSPYTAHPLAFRASGPQLHLAAGLPVPAPKGRKAPSPKASPAAKVAAKAKVERATGIGAKGGALAVVRAAARIRATEAYKAGAPVTQAEACEAFGVTANGPSPEPRPAQVKRAKAILAEAGQKVAEGI